MLVRIGLKAGLRKPRRKMQKGLMGFFTKK